MSAPIDNGGQAFPRAGFDGPSFYSDAVEGMTLRDYFAAKALPAIYSEYHLFTRTGGGFQEGWQQGLASDAYQLADAMLAARKEVAP